MNEVWLPRPNCNLDLCKNAAATLGLGVTEIDGIVVAVTHQAMWNSINEKEPLSFEKHGMGLIRLN